MGDASKNGHWHGFRFIYLTLCHVQLLEKRIVSPCEINGVVSERILTLKDVLSCFCVEHCLQKVYILPHCNLIWKYLHPHIPLLFLLIILFCIFFLLASYWNTARLTQNVNTVSKSWLRPWVCSRVGNKVSTQYFLSAVSLLLHQKALAKRCMYFTCSWGFVIILIPGFFWPPIYVFS